MSAPSDPLRAAAERAARSFAIEGELLALEPLARGHIHETFVSTWQQDGAQRRFLHQRMNDKVFHDVPGLMHNIQRVTDQLRLPSWRADDHELEVLTLVPTRKGGSYLRNPDGAWRTFVFVDGTRTHDTCQGPEQAYDAARAFGNFQARLFDLDARELCETIPDFFSTPHRLRQFDAALRADPCDRAAQVAREIAFVQDRRAEAAVFEVGMEQGRIPTRVVHGDTKLNNVLFDAETGAARCIVDLDTCMPGWMLYDFGDLVRFTAATSAEDERDLDRAGVDLELYGALAAGWLDSASRFMTHDELDLMPFAARLVTYTVGVRFLTDHLAGDVYFKTSREGHNLDRARVQFTMVRAMEQQADAMQAAAARAN